MTPKPIITIKADPMLDRGFFAWLNDKEDNSLGTTIGDCLAGLDLPGISYEVERGLAEWAIQLLNYYQDLKFKQTPPAFDWDTFNQQGLKLARRLKQEVGDTHKVIYEKYHYDPTHDIDRQTTIEVNPEECTLTGLYSPPAYYEPNEPECQWVATTCNPAAAKLCVKFAAAINRLDARMMLPLLAESVEYTSPSFEGKLVGIESAGRRLAGIMEDIHHGRARRLTRAELVADSSNNQPAVLICRRDSAYGRPGLGRPFQYMSLDGNDAGKITRIIFQDSILTGYKQSGLFPGLDALTVQADRDFQGDPLILSPDVRFALYLNEDNSTGRRLQAGIEKMLPEYSPVTFATYYSQDAMCQTRRVTCFPTFDVMERKTWVRRLEGIKTAGEIRRKIADLFEGILDFEPSPELAAHPGYAEIPDHLKPFAEVDQITGAISFINDKTLHRRDIMAKGVAWKNKKICEAIAGRDNGAPNNKRQKPKRAGGG